jgi:hypothetical protein
MRQLIADIYRITLRITGNKLFSLLCALLYVSTLNLIILYGIILLLQDWMPGMSMVVKIFAFPNNILMAIFMMCIDFLIMLPLRYLLKDIRKHASIIPVVVYSFVSLLVLLYSHYVGSF